MGNKADPLLRAMLPADIDSMGALARESVGAPSWTLADYRNILLSRGDAPFYRMGLVAESEGRLAGFAVVSVLRIEASATLESIAVHRDFRRRAIGTALLQAAVRAAEKAGTRSMQLEVRASNADAISFYQATGFRRTGRRRAYYTVPVEDAILFERTLSDDKPGR